VREVVASTYNILKTITALLNNHVLTTDGHGITLHRQSSGQKGPQKLHGDRRAIANRSPLNLAVNANSTTVPLYVFFIMAIYNSLEAHEQELSSRWCSHDIIDMVYHCNITPNLDLGGAEIELIVTHDNYTGYLAAKRDMRLYITESANISRGTRGAYATSVWQESREER
jgi:hypothetical protein